MKAFKIITLGTLFFGLTLIFNMPAFADEATKAKEQIINSTPNEASFIARLSLKDIRKSEKAKALLKNWEMTYQTHIDNVAEYIGLIWEDIDSAWIIGKDKKEPLIVLEGEFDITAIEDAAFMGDAVKAVEVEGAEIAVLFDDKGKDKMGAIINRHLLIVGEPDIVKPYAEMLADGNPKMDPTRKLALKSLATSESLIHGMLFKLPKKDTEGKPLLKKLSYGEAKVEYEKDLLIKASVFADTVQTAQICEGLMQGLIGLGVANEGKEKNIIQKELLENIKVSRTGNELILNSKISSSVVDGFVLDKLAANN